MAAWRIIRAVGVPVGRRTPGQKGMPVKLVTWNCQGAFRKKFGLIASQAPDLAVIEECEHPERITWKGGQAPSTALWFGEKPTRGVGIFSWSGWQLAPLDGYDPSIRYCIPLEVLAPLPFHLLAVWAMDHPDGRLSYSAQVYQALVAYRDFILGTDTLVMGDFNSSRRTTPHSRIGNHTTLTMALADLGMISAYHFAAQEKQGHERRGTYFRGRKQLRPAHIDYAFIPTRWLRRLRRVEVGDPATWLAFSDHCPVWVEVAEKSPTQVV
jgi:exodeoxyribonuclease-3